MNINSTKPHPLVIFAIMLVLAYLLTGCQHTWFPPAEPDQDAITILEVQW
jgi:hypothetical protein